MEPSEKEEILVGNSFFFLHWWQS